MRRTCIVATVALTALTALVWAAADSPVADAAMRRDLASVRSLIAGGADASVRRRGYGSRRFSSRFLLRTVGRWWT